MLGSICRREDHRAARVLGAPPKSLPPPQTAAMPAPGAIRTRALDSRTVLAATGFVAPQEPSKLAATYLEQEHQEDKGKGEIG